MKSLFLVTVLGFLAFLVYWVRHLLTPRERTALFSAATLSALAFTFALYPSDPRDWNWAELVLYLAAPRLEPLAVLGSLLTGSLLFGVFTLGIYWANRRRSVKKHGKARP